MAFTVYVLQSETSGLLYIGHTKDLERRLSEHAAGQTRSTRGRGPWTLLHAEPFGTRSEAMRFEHELKRLKSPARVLALLSER